MINGKRVLVVFLLTMFFVSFVSATDVGFITKNNPNAQIMKEFQDMGLSVEVIKDADVKKKDLSQYTFIFVDDGILRNTATLPIYNYPSILMNRYYGEQFGLTDTDGISQLASNSPLQVKTDKGKVQQVYTQAYMSVGGGAAIPYYYLDDENKANFHGLARTYVGNGPNNYEFGDVVATANEGTQLLNGRVNKGKMCFFGIAETKYWTQDAKLLFEECVGFVSSVCENDSQCNDNDEYTKDTCQNPGTVNAMCVYTPIKCLSELDCGVDGYVGGDYCSENSVVRDYIDYTCNNAGTTSSSCSDEVIEETQEVCSDVCLDGTCRDITCSFDYECDDTNNHTYDQCLNPGTIDSSCRHTPIECLNNAECNDGNRNTEDVCNNAGTVDSFCENKPIECFVNSDCGTDGYVDAPFCSEGNVAQNYKTFTCNNPGNENASCSNSVELREKEVCSDACSNGACVEIVCSVNSDCDDGNERTIDQCANPGTTASFCRNNEVNCLNDLDCGFTGFVGENYCSAKDVYKNYQTATCMNAGTFQSYCNIDTTPQVVQMCDDNNSNTIDSCGTTGGIASCVYNQISCSKESDCGTDGYVSELYCSINGNSVRDYKDYTCNNPGTVQSSCSSTTETKVVEQCSSSCLEGQCVDIVCSKNADCGTDGYVSELYCSINGNSVRDYKDYECINKGTPQSYCQVEDEQKIIDDCNSNEMCTDGTCVAKPTIACTQESDCGTDGYVSENYCSANEVVRDYVDYTCNNAGTASSSCSSTTTSRQIEQCSSSETCSNGACIEQPPIECNVNSECGTNGYISESYCSTNTVKKDYITYTCNDAGTPSSYCSSDVSARTVQQCNVNQQCSGGACANNPPVACTIDLDCNDGNVRTVDQCINAGTPSSYCRNTEVNCVTNVDCGVTGYTGNEFCWQSDIYKTYQTATCENAGTLQSYCNVAASPKVVQMCDDGNSLTIDRCDSRPSQTPSALCVNTPITVACSKNTDCGVDGYSGSNFCSQDDVYREYTSYLCNNPGTSGSYCSSKNENRLIEQCSETCSNGICQETEIPQCDIIDDHNGEGFYAEYYNYPKSHVDMEKSFEALANEVISNPLASDWNRDWYSGGESSDYYRFSRIDSDLEFGEDFFPFDGSRSEEVDSVWKHDYYFGAHYQGIVKVDEPGAYTLKMVSDDDSWVYVDGKLVINNGRVHTPEVTKVHTMNFEGGEVIEIYYAERHVGRAHLDFEYSEGMEVVPYYPLCPVPDYETLAQCPEGTEKIFVGTTELKANDPKFSGSQKVNGFPLGPGRYIVQLGDGSFSPWANDNSVNGPLSEGWIPGNSWFSKVNIATYDSGSNSFENEVIKTTYFKTSSEAQKAGKGLYKIVDVDWKNGQNTAYFWFSDSSISDNRGSVKVDVSYCNPK